MSAPDTTAAFDADAEKSSELGKKDAEVARLRARLAELEHPQDDREVFEGELLDGEDKSTEVEAAHSVEVAGTVFRFHVPKTTALTAFGMGLSNLKNGRLALGTMHRFFEFHLLEEDYEKLRERMMDPNDQWGDEQFGELMTAMTEAGSNSAEARAPKHGPR